MARVLITGGAGFIGFHLAKRLVESGNDVTIADNLSRGRMDDDFKAFLDGSKAKFVQCDLTKPEELKQLGAFDHVYHLAAVQGTKNFYEKPKHVIRTNILSTINVLDWFVASGSKKIMYASSSEAYAGTVSRFGAAVPTPEDVPLCIEDVYNPRWSYGGSKIAGELLFTNYGKTDDIDFVIVRYHNVYGPRMGTEHVVPEFILRTLRKEDPFSVFGGVETRAFCYIEDAVRASQVAMESDASKTTIHIGNDNPEVKILDLAKTIHRLMGVSPKMDIKPAPKGSVARRCPDITKLRTLGFEPTIGLEEGLKKTIDWYTAFFKKGV